MHPQTLQACLADLDSGLLQRDAAVRALLLAALAGEHVLLIGPPGTAKSELARRLRGVFVGARYFERLLTRFSVPEELFGPLSLQALENDRYERLTDGFLPTAQVAFLDEVFKANSAILNALLTLLNEREFDNGSGRVPVPLITVVGASNEVPTDESLAAFFDRFLLRVPVAAVDDAHFGALLALPPQPAAAPARLCEADLQTLRQRAHAVALPEPVVERLAAARVGCAAAGIGVSDRRWRKVVHLLRVMAASRQADVIDPWDLWVLPLVLADRPEQVPALIEDFLREVGGAVPVDAQWLGRVADALERQLEIESSASATGEDGAAGKLALAQAIAGPAAEGQVLVRMVAEGARRRYSPLHIAARVAQAGEARERAASACAVAVAEAERARCGAAGHPWLPPSWRARIDAVHGANVDLLQALHERLAAVADAFAALPVDAALAGPAPLPVPSDH
jgi:MoxR-like ATPase